MSQSQRFQSEDNPEGITSSFLSLRAGLHKFLMRFLVRRQDVEDIVQETFMRAYESERHQKIEYPKSFLFTVARNIALSEIERKGTRVTSYVSDMQDLNIAAEQNVEDNVDAEQRLSAVLKVVATLPPQCQRVVIMKKILGFSHQEIGRRLQISVRTVEKHLAKALQRCQESFLKEDAGSPAPFQGAVSESRSRRGQLLAMRGRRE